MERKDDETEFLNRAATTYVTSESHQERTIKQLAVRAFAPHLRGMRDGLELGCSDGYMTSLISKELEHLTVVDGSNYFLERARGRNLKNVTFIHSLFEEYIPKRQFDCIFISYVLEHMRDPVLLLERAAKFLTERGLIFLVVPNARALSRQLARHMGILDDLYALTPNDLAHGHRRVYDRILLDKDISSAGLIQVSRGGLMLKPFADFQMDTM